MENVKSEIITFKTKDESLLTGTLYTPGSTDAAPMLIGSAMATHRSFYEPIAEWFADHGFRVLTFDYQGIGDSRSTPVRESNITLYDWAQDLAYATKYLKSHHDGRAPYVLAHSLAGQIFGLIGGSVSIKVLVTFSSQSGYWRIQHPGQRLKLLVLSYIAFPLVNNLFGYLPWSQLFGGEDVPSEAGRQWYQSCRYHRYLLDNESIPGRDNYRKFSAPILAYSFEDDKWGYKKAVDQMMDAYSGTEVERIHIKPSDLGVEKIGHFGFFRRGMSSLWENLLTRLKEIG